MAHPLGKRTVLNRPCAFEPRLLRQSLDRWQSLLYCTRLESVRACGHRRLESYPIRQFGEMAERLMAPVLKTGAPPGAVSSNLTLSAMLCKRGQIRLAAPDCKSGSSSMTLGVQVPPLAPMFRTRNM